jgi:chromosomal replication initiator protein
VQYVTSEEFLNLYVEALQNKTLPSFRRHFRSLDMLLIDDVQFFAGKVGLTEEFFHTFNTLHNAHKQIVMACDRPPREIAGLEERLVSRFEWGLSSEMLPPEDLAVRIAILHKKQAQYEEQFSDEVLQFIAERIRTNVRSLESALKKLVMHASAFKCEMTVELVGQLLADKFDSQNARQLSIESIQKRVAEHFDIRVGDMTSKKRPANIAVPRMVAMYLSRELTGKSLPAIGEAFNRNHATVINAVKTIERKMKADETLRGSVGLLTRQLRS